MATKNTGAAGEAGSTGSTTPRKKTAGAKQAAAKSDGGAKKQDGAGAKKTAAKKAAPKKAAATTAAKSAPRTRAKMAGGGLANPDLRSDLRDFVRQNPQGWGHDEWTGLLGRLRERGHQGNEEQIGSALERERLAMKLEEMEGVGPQRVKSLVDRFGTLYSLRHAAADEVAEAAKIPRELAEKITRTLR